MAIETDASGTKYIKWTAPTGVVGLTQKSLLIWLYPNDFGGAYEPFLISDGTGSDSDEWNSFSTQITTGKIGWVAHFSTTNGIWLTTSATMTAGVANHIAVTYDGSSTSNNPVIYIAGTSVSVTTSTAPVGTYRTGTSTDVYINSLTSGSNIDGKILSLCYYNRILSASEIADAYASKKNIPTRRGLVFAPQLHSRGEVGEGGTLTASHTIADNVSGSLGTPSGSPLFRGDTYLTFDE